MAWIMWGNQHFLTFPLVQRIFCLNWQPGNPDFVEWLWLYATSTSTFLSCKRCHCDLNGNSIILNGYNCILKNLHWVELPVAAVIYCIDRFTVKDVLKLQGAANLVIILCICINTTPPFTLMHFLMAIMSIMIKQMVITLLKAKWADVNLASDHKTIWFITVIKVGFFLVPFFWYDVRLSKARRVLWRKMSKADLQWNH